LFNKIATTSQIRTTNLTSHGTPLPEEVSRGILLSSGLTTAGAAAVEMALDPFHDYKIHELEGWVDNYQGNSLVQVYTRQYQIKSDATFGTNLWDAQIVLTQSDIAGLFRQVLIPASTIVPTQRLSVGLNPLSLQVSTSEPIACYGGLTVIRNVTGGSLNPFMQDSTQLVNAIEYASNSALSTTNFNLSGRPFGSYRVMSAGAEVRDDTATLYQQGSKVMWRHCDYNETIYANLTKNITINTSTASTFVTNSGYLLMRVPPVNATEARNIPNSLSGLAKDGCYIVSTQRTSVLPPSRIVDSRWMFSNESTAGLSNTPSAAASIWISDPEFFSTASTTAAINPNVCNLGTPLHDSGMNPCGAIFSGLNPASTLTVTLKVVIEMFPRTDDPVLIPLCSPSPCLDVLALEMYQRALGLLPVGCDVADNLHGDWWKNIVKNFKRGYSMGKRAVKEIGKVPGLGNYAEDVLGIMEGSENLVKLLKDDRKNLTAENKALLKRIAGPPREKKSVSSSKSKKAGK
jgi:hypothetical protein